jgi:hypothetical protein
MKWKDLFNKVINKSNNQVVLNPKKKLIRRMGYDDIDEILEMKIENKFKKMLYK